MGSRIRVNPGRIFECFCEVVSPSASGQDPWILQKFPDTFNSEELLKPLPQFAHPCPVVLTGVQHFSFVLTNLDSKWTYGFCRHTPDSETSICMLSYLPWHETFYKILNFIAELTFKSEQTGLWNFLQTLYDTKIPNPHSQIKVNFDHQVFSCVCPDYSKLPSIPENRNLTEYFNAIDATNMITIFASMLCERRILITSKRLNRLSACVQAANALIYPMHWQHIFIPVLPSHLLDYLSAPMPFLIGVPTSIMTRVKRSELGEAVILDADKNKIESPFNDYNSMPSDIVSSLKKKLKNPQNMLGEGVSLAFVRALVHIIGGYRDALKLKSGEQITFSDEAFIRSRPQSLQPFLEKMLQLQIFQQFIEERLDKLNSGNGFSDEFEYEINKYSERNSIKLKTQYREWVTNMKKEGGAFFKTVKSKANPAMKHAVKSVKDKGKRAYKDIRTKIHDLQIKPAGTTDFHVAEEDRQPRSAPASPTSPRSVRPHTIYNPKMLRDGMVRSLKKNKDQRNISVVYHSKNHVSEMSSTEEYTADIDNSTSAEDTDDKQDDEDDDEEEDDSCNTNDDEMEDGIPEYKALNMDLMGDLQDIIFRKCSLSSSNSSPSIESKVSLTESQSMNEFKTGVTPSSSTHPFTESLSLIRLDSVDNNVEFDPLKSGMSPTSPPSDSFTLDILRELANPRPSNENFWLSNQNTEKPQQSNSAVSTNPFKSNFSSEGHSSSTIASTDSGTTNFNQRPTNAAYSGQLNNVPILKPLSIAKTQNNAPVDPFADLVKWGNPSQTAPANPKMEWQTFN